MNGSFCCWVRFPLIMLILKAFSASTWYGWRWLLESPEELHLWSLLWSFSEQLPPQATHTYTHRWALYLYIAIHSEKCRLNRAVVVHRGKAICLWRVRHAVHSALPPGQTQEGAQRRKAVPVWPLPSGESYTIHVLLSVSYLNVCYLYWSTRLSLHCFRTSHGQTGCWDTDDCVRLE